MNFIFQTGPQGRNILVDSFGRIIANSASGDAPFVYSFGPEGHPVSVDASGRLLIYDVNAGSGGGSGATNLNDLTDVILTAPTSGQILQYDGLFWENVTPYLETLLNVSGTAVSGQFLYFNGSVWTPSDVILSLDDLSDVIISSPNETDALIYSGGIWVASGLTPLIDSRIPVQSVNGQSGIVVLNLNDINDVNTNSAVSGNYLALSGSTWIGRNITFPVTSVNGETGAVSLSLDDITDVNTSGATSGEFLQYNGTNWINQNVTVGINIPTQWRFNSSTSTTNPGARRFSFNSGILSSVTEIYINDMTDGGVDVSNFLAELSLNDKIYIQQLDDSEKAALFNVISTQDNTGWWTIDVTVISSNIIMDNNAKCGLLLSYIGSEHFSLNDLSDVNTTGASNTDVLALSGSTWVPSGITFPVTSVNGETGVVSLILDDIADVTITAIASGELIKWDGSTWINNTLAEAGISAVGHTHSLDNLSDVTITSPVSGQILRYNGSIWENYVNVPFRDRVVYENADFNAVVNTIHLIETTAGSITGEMPNSHSPGDMIIIKDAEGSADSNNIFMNSSQGIDSDTVFKMDSVFQSVTMVSDGNEWFII